MSSWKLVLRNRAKSFAETLYRTRGFFPILTLAGAPGAILAWMAQGQDLLRAGIDINGGSHWAILWIFISVVALAFQAWFWARVIIEEEFKYIPNWRSNVYLVWAPRLLGLIPYVLMVIALMRLAQSGVSTWLAILLAAAGAGFLIFLWFRLPLTRALEHAEQTYERAGKTGMASVIKVSLGRLRQIVLAGGLLYAIVAILVTAFWPVGPAVFFGPVAIVFAACALIIPVFTTLMLVVGRYHVSVALLLFLLVVVVSLLPDNHNIRLTRAEPVRTNLKEHLERWKAQAQPAANGKIPMIFVASAGGASRAGYWTSAVMSQLEVDTGGKFSSHVFAVSSISGGSLGVAGFLANLKDGMTSGGLRRSVSDFVGRDYLSPAVAGMLFTDLVQRFIPFPIFPDRAEALEKGWELGWQYQCKVAGCGSPELFQKDFLGLWDAAPRWLPVWMIGGTIQQDGRPVLTSNVNFGDAIDAWDFHSLAKHDVRLSTAISNGARFPLVSPSGTIHKPDMPEKPSFIHIVDGGYFDAAGGETVRQLAQAMFQSEELAGMLKDVEPIFLLISNDGINPAFADRGELEAGMPVPPYGCRGKAVRSGCPGGAGLSRFAPDLTGPIQGLYRGRDAHGERLKAILFSAPPQMKDAAQPSRVLTLDLCSAHVPMNWALSKSARDLVDRLLTKDAPKGGACEDANTKSYEALKAVLE